MSRRGDSGRTISRFLRRVEIALLALAVVSPRPSSAADQTLLLDVQVNGHAIGKVGEFTMRDGVLMVRREELRDLGLRGPLVLVPRTAGPSFKATDAFIDLSKLPGLTWRLDAKTQTLYVTAVNDRLLPTVLLLADESRSKAGGHRIESGTGMTLNYDVTGTSSAGRNGGAGSFDFLAFSRQGVISSQWLGYAGAPEGGLRANSVVRLDSMYSFADVNTLRRYSLGDFITGSLAWTRPIRLTGAQIRSDFSMRPDLITFPLPSVSGSVAVPSTVDVLADGNLVISRQIDAGPFQIPQLPVVSGAGMISMTVTNALGQQVNVTQPFYASSTLLAPGLQTFSGQIGLVRRNWGEISNDYGKLAGTAFYRRGLTPKTTMEGTFEATPGAVLAGGGGVFQVGHLGVINLAAAASAGSQGVGALISTGAQRIGRVVSVGASAILASRNYQDVAAINGEPVPRDQINANVGLSLRRLGSIGVGYGGLDRDASTTSVQLYLAQAQHAHILSANYSIELRHRMSLYVTEYQDFVQNGSGGLQVGLTIPFGLRSSAGVSVSSDGSAQVQAQQSAALIREWGYQAYLSAGNTTHEFVEGQYKSPWGLFTAGVDSNGGQTSLRLEAAGSLSLADKGLFAANTIYDSFAIVDTNGLAHVHVLEENRDAGTTNSAGKLLLPDLRSFDINRIAVDPSDIPQDSSIDTTTREVRPQDRSGVVVRFAVKVSHGALLKLVDEAGVPVPMGSTATLRTTGDAVPVGYDGEAYVQGLEFQNEVTVELVDGRYCSVFFTYRAVRGEVPSIGPLYCRTKAP